MKVKSSEQDCVDAPLTEVIGFPTKWMNLKEATQVDGENLLLGEGLGGNPSTATKEP